MKEKSGSHQVQRTTYQQVWSNSPNLQNQKNIRSYKPEDNIFGPVFEDFKDILKAVISHHVAH